MIAERMLLHLEVKAGVKADLIVLKEETLEETDRQGD